MTGLVEVDVTEDGIGMMTIQPPPAGAPEAAVRSEIAAALDDLMARADLRGLVLRAPGRRFADGIAAEADSPAQAAPTLADLCARLEDCPVPVVAAIHGVASGAGLEFAMAADDRVAGPQAHFALPGIAVGMLPVAGATQRLPRLVGVPAALEILLAGKSFAPAEAARLGLIDRAVSEAPGQAALGLLRALTPQGADGLRPTSARMDRMTDYARNASAVASARHKAASQPGPAAARIVDCVEAAFMLPFEAGVYYESAARDEVARSPQTRALRHLRQAQRRAAPVTGDAAGHVAIAGGGEEAAKLAVRALDAGLKVTVAAPTESGRDGTQEMIVRLYHLAEAEGRVSERGLADRIARLELATGLERLVRAEVVFVPLPAGAEAAKRRLPPWPRPRRRGRR